MTTVVNNQYVDSRCVESGSVTRRGALDPTDWRRYRRSPILRLSMACVLALTGALPLASHAKTLDVETATIADLDAAFAAGKLTSEQLVSMYLKRIEAYDKQGPRINAVITLNPKAMEIAKALDAERKAKGPRSPIHGIPIVLKDNYNTFDLPTTAGSQIGRAHV